MDLICSIGEGDNSNSFAIRYKTNQNIELKTSIFVIDKSLKSKFCSVYQSLISKFDLILTQLKFPSFFHVNGCSFANNKKMILRRSVRLY